MSVTYALLNDRTEAQAAINELKEIESPLKVNINVHDHVPHVDSLKMSETGLLKGMGQGALFGSVGSVLVLTLLNLVGLVTGGWFHIASLAFILGGGYGTMVGAVAGSSCPDLALEGLEKKKSDDGLILTIQTLDPEAADKASRILSKHGAIEEHPEKI